MSHLNPNQETDPPTQSNNSNEQSLRDMLNETLQAMNKMIATLASITQPQQNQHFVNLDGIPNANQNSEAHPENMNNHQIGRAHV